MPLQFNSSGPQLNLTDFESSPYNSNGYIDDTVNDDLDLPIHEQYDVNNFKKHNDSYDFHKIQGSGDKYGSLELTPTQEPNIESDDDNDDEINSTNKESFTTNWGIFDYRLILFFGFVLIVLLITFAIWSNQQREIEESIETNLSMNFAITKLNHHQKLDSL
jgi:hypothetical protein